MPTHRGIEVWIEDSRHQKVNDHGVVINLVDPDDSTVTVKTEMSRDELYTVHCLSPISVFCDVFVTTPSGERKIAARFYLDKSLTISQSTSGSSTGHTVEQFRDHGLKTPKRQFQQGKLGTVEVEIRRIGEIIRGEPNNEYENDEEGVDLTMIDEPNQLPWLIFRFEIRAKGSAAPASATKHIKRHAPRYMPKKQGHGRALGSSLSKKKSHEIGHEFLHSTKKHPREHDDDKGFSSVDQGVMDVDSDLLQEYQKEEAEEKRLLRKLHEQLQTKKIQNMKLRRLLGETE